MHTIFPVSIEIHLTNSYLFSITSVHARKPQAPLSNKSLPSSVRISLTSKKIPSRNRPGSPKWVHSRMLTAQNNLSLPKSRSSSLPPRRAAVGWIANTSSLLKTAISSWINRQLIQPLISNRKKYQWRQKFYQKKRRGVSRATGIVTVPCKRRYSLTMALLYQSFKTKSPRPGVC